MTLQVSIPTGKSGNAINSNTGSVTLAEKNGVKFLITAAHVTNPSNAGNNKNNNAASVKNSETGKEIKLDSFTSVGKYDLAVNKLSREEENALKNAGVDTNKTLKLPEVTNGATSELPKDLTTTSNFKGGKDQGISTHKVAEAKDGSDGKNQQQIDVKDEQDQTNTEYDQTHQFEIADPGDKLGKGSSGGGLANNGSLYGVVSTEINKITGGKPEDQAKVGNIRAVDLRSKEVQADIGKALNVAA